MNPRLTVAVAALGAVLVVGALAWSTALAQTPTSKAGAIHGTTIARAAAILGVPEAKLTDALAQAHDQALDDAVTAGQLTQAQADWMKQRMRAGAMGAGMMGAGMMGAGNGMMGGAGTMAGHAAMMGGQAAAEHCLGAPTPAAGR